MAVDGAVTQLILPSMAWCQRCDKSIKVLEMYFYLAALFITYLTLLTVRYAHLACLAFRSSGLEGNWISVNFFFASLVIFILPFCA